MLYDKRWELDQIGRILSDAADYLNEHGWVQHSFETPDGQVCVEGAIQHVSGVDHIKVGDAIYRLKLSLFMRPSEWNDHVCRSKSQAVAALRKAALLG